MLFCACRAADLLNAFVGLWLVPKYVGTKELGALMPLTQFAGFLALPVSIFAMTFMKEMTGLATNGEYGKMKSLMRGVFIGAGVFLIIALAISKLAMPLFLERIRVAEGSLGVLILAAAFTSAIAPVYQNALQALRRFKTISILNVIGAPVRLLAMLVAMPFRALSGYYVGQTAAPIFVICTSIWSLRKELSFRAEPYWTRPIVRQLLHLLIGISAYHLAGGLLGLVEQTILRQRLPEIESAAYYMTTRLADIASFVCATLTTVLFPFTASLAAEGKPTRQLAIKASLAMLSAGILLACVFSVAAKPILSALPNGDQYSDYAWAVPCLIMVTSITAIQIIHTNTEASAGRLGFLKWWVPLNIIFAAILPLYTGFGYFRDYLPNHICEFIATHNFTSLGAMIVWFAVTAIIKTAFSIYELLKQD